MALIQRHAWLQTIPTSLGCLLALCLLCGSYPLVRADDLQAPVEKTPAVFDKPLPESVEDLKAIEEQVEKVLEKVIPCTVGVRIGAHQGSGVIVSKDGYVLTAGHVSGQPGRDVSLVLPTGKTVKGKTLGMNGGIDSGLIKITSAGDWPFLDMGKSAELKPGQWVISCGHPGGYRTGRPPVVRVGRVLKTGSTVIVSDCTLVGGDSGGPLFDMKGQVVGIHSRISGSITGNMHVPVDTYRDTWERLVKGDAWRGDLPLFAAAGGPFVGVQGDPNTRDCIILKVVEGSPAEKAGIKTNDVVRKFDGQKVEKYKDFFGMVQKKKPGDEVELDIQRGEETVTVKMMIGKRKN